MQKPPAALRPASWLVAAVPGQEHLPPTLLRLSVGVEDADDPWADLAAALDAAAADDRR
jgi:cystathionine beta-lyase/cystathionine gamma-synthase